MVDEEVARRLADAVRARREQLGMTQADVVLAARNAGLSLSTQSMTLIESGKRDEIRTSTATALEQVLRWAPGSVLKLRAGLPIEEAAPALAPVGQGDDYAVRLARVERQLGLGGDDKTDDVRTVAGVLRMLSPEQIRVFREALAQVEGET